MTAGFEELFLTAEPLPSLLVHRVDRAVNLSVNLQVCPMPKLLDGEALAEILRVHPHPHPRFDLCILLDVDHDQVALVAPGVFDRLPSGRAAVDHLSTDLVECLAFENQ